MTRTTKLMLATLAALTLGCAVSRESLPPEQVATYDGLVKAEAAAEARVQAAEAAVAADPGDMTAQAELLATRGDYDAAEKALADFETQVLRDRYGSFMAGLSAVPGVGQWLAMLGPLGMGLVPLFSRRGRKHYGKAVMSLNPFSKVGADNKPIPGTQVSPLEALLSVGRAVGLLHSSKESQQAAEASGAA